MIKVLHYAPGFRNGGIESRLLDWYRNTDRSKIQYVLVKLNNIDDTENMKEFVKLGGKYYNLPPITATNLLMFSSRIKKILIKEEINIVHVHNPTTGFFVLKEAQKLGLKCRILHSRTTNYLPNEKNVFFKNIFRRYSQKYANHFFGCSYEAGLWGCGEQHKDEIVVLKNGIQADKFVFNNEIRKKIRADLKLEGKVVVGTIGRLSPQKNLPFLLKVFTTLTSCNNNYILLIVGDGNRNIVKDFFKGEDVPYNIVMVGNKKNVWDYYMAFDVFCSCSLYEGFGTTAIEAQATGVPTLLSDAFPEVVAITSFVRRMGVQESNIPEWITAIKELSAERFPKEGMDSVVMNGYSASVVAKDLQSFYLSNA